MPYTIARYAGYCAGVRRAMEIAFQAAREARECGIRCYSLGELIHNPDAVNALKREGVISCSSMPQPISPMSISTARRSARTAAVIRLSARKLQMKSDTVKTT